MTITTAIIAGILIGFIMYILDDDTPDPYA